MKNYIITSLDSLYLDVNIGVTSEERVKKQKLKISFKLYQTSLEEIKDDGAKKYNCYANIAREINKYCSSREFNLLEYLCYQIYNLINNYVEANTKVYVLVEKLDIAVDDMVFNARAEYSDL
jgi:FolB domain-containing protein